MPKTHDTIGRQNRYIKTLTDEVVSKQPRDLVWLKALHDHGKLNSYMLHEFTKDTHRCRYTTVKRLMLLTRAGNSEYGAPLLERYHEANYSAVDWGKFIVYGLSPRGEQVLKDARLWSENRPRARNPFRHETMCAHITACIALDCKDRGYRYIPQHELLDPVFSEQEYKLAVPIEYKFNSKKEVKPLIPDALFAIDYKGKYRAFTLEADRSTEAIIPTIDHGKSFKRSYLQYEQLIAKGLYKKAYGLKTGMVNLNVTIGDTRTNSFIKALHNELGDTTYQWFMTADEFAGAFKPPKRIDRFTTSKWQTAGCGERDIMEP